VTMDERQLSIKTVRPVESHAEALDYLRDMCVYWYKMRPAFPGTPESLLAELGKWIDPAAGPASAPAPAPPAAGGAALDPRVLAQVVQSAERVARMNRGAPGVAELMAAVERLQASVSRSAPPSWRDPAHVTVPHAARRAWNEPGSSLGLRLFVTPP